MGSILPAAKTEGTCFASPPPNLFSGKKEKPPDSSGFELEQVTSETSVTFPSPLLLPLPYGQHFACGKNPGNLLRLSSPESFQRQKEKPPDFGWLLIGAGYEARTRYLHLGKVALYQMS